MDDLLFLSEAAKLIPTVRAGRKVHVSTLLRWIKAGKVRGYRCGPVWKISREDVERIIRSRQPVAPPEKPASTRTRDAEKAAAKEYLRRMGVL